MRASFRMPQLFVSCAVDSVRAWRPNHMTKTKRKSHDDELDDALKHTFPASDPVSVGGDENRSGARIDREPAELDHNLVDRLAREVKRKANEPQ